MNLTIPEFEDKAELYDWLITNKTALKAQKKASIKLADAFSYSVQPINDKGDVIKSDSIPDTAKAIKVRAIINTTKLLDSHGDVHIDQLWNKSIKETKDNYLVKQHDFSFDGIISDDVKVMTKRYSWKDLGFDYEGDTQALVYDAVISKADPTGMFEKYRQGKVKQHSVGMRYVSLDMAINDTRYEKEKAIWDKYINIVANKADAEQLGYFWAVTEAKNIEGSAVVRGSNFATPTQSIQETKTQPVTTTAAEPSKDTRLLEQLNKLSNTLKN